MQRRYVVYKRNSSTADEYLEVRKQLEADIAARKEKKKAPLNADGSSESLPSTAAALRWYYCGGARWMRSTAADSSDPQMAVQSWEAEIFLAVSRHVY